MKKKKILAVIVGLLLTASSFSTFANVDEKGNLDSHTHIQKSYIIQKKATSTTPKKVAPEEKKGISNDLNTALLDKIVSAAKSTPEKPIKLVSSNSTTGQERLREVINYLIEHGVKNPIFIDGHKV